MQKAQAFLEKYFWDTDFADLDVKHNRDFILKRILEYGDAKAVAWMNKNYKRSEIVRLLTSARISPKSANYWAYVFGIKRDGLLCLKKPYLRMRRRTWLY